jgi:ankyrin repeat protein
MLQKIFTTPPMKINYLLLASLLGHEGVVEYLLAMPGIKVNEADECDRTPLLCAAAGGHTAIVSQLLAVPGIEVNKADKNGRMPISQAVWNRHTAIINQLLAMPEIEVHKRDKDGHTPVTLASWYWDKALMRQLLAIPKTEVSRADKDDHWQTLSDIERWERYSYVVGQLSSNSGPGTEVNEINKNNQMLPSLQVRNTSDVNQSLAGLKTEVNNVDEDEFSLDKWSEWDDKYEWTIF